MRQKTNVCVIGGSGVGKSTVLRYVFAETTARVDPYRARPDGARKGEDRFVSPQMWEHLRQMSHALYGKPVVELSSARGGMDPCSIGGRDLKQWLKIYADASFFTVREDTQVLLHHDLDLNAEFRKVELFAPVFRAILANEPARRAMPFLKDATTIFILLNPLAKSVRDIQPSDITDNAGWMREDWADLQYQRSLILGDLDGLDKTEREKKLSKMMDRVDKMPYEVTAWKGLQVMSEQPDAVRFVECLGWPHFEYKYLGTSDKEITKRTAAAKKNILGAASSTGLDVVLTRMWS